MDEKQVHQSQVANETNVKPKEKQNYPTEIIDLPSKGKLYSPESPLSSGKIEIKYPTAREEDILTSKNLIQKGIVIDKFIESLVVDKNININEILLGDKNAIIIASRILAYGKNYDVEITCPKCTNKNKETLDISKIESKDIDGLDDWPQGQNEFKFKLPASKKTIVFRALTQHDEKMIDAELKSMKKMNKNKDIDHEITTRLKYAIVSIDGDSENIQSFVNSMLSIDSRELRKEINRVVPDVDMEFNYECENCGHEERMDIPLGIEFFWPST